MVGKNIILWIWGGFAVGASTLGLFFVLHFIFPFLICFVVGVHLVRLHSSGSSSPLIVQVDELKTDFSPNYMLKDLFNINFWLMFVVFSLLFPFLLGDPEMFIEANPLVRPVHIVPE